MPEGQRWILYLGVTWLTNLAEHGVSETGRTDSKFILKQGFSELQAHKLLKTNLEISVVNTTTMTIVNGLN
jgi:hypothetical protein